MLKVPLTNNATAKMKEAQAGAAPFVAYIAHELRNSLATQRAILELTLADRNADVAVWRDAGHDVLAACRQQERVLAACITLSRSGGGLGRCETVDLAATIAGLLRSTDLGGFTTTVSLEPAATTGDQVLIERLLDNLLANAVRHNRASGWIAITSGVQAGRAVITVENTGAPIPADEIPRLFESFEQIDVSGARAGLGLGLAVVKAIADAHGARVSAHVRSGGGLRVEAAFPLMSAPSDGAALPRSQRPDHVALVP
jgi:signal transduction histidine kinase